MVDLGGLQYAFAHDPYVPANRRPFGACKCSASVWLELDADASVRDGVQEVWLEVFDSRSDALRDGLADASGESVPFGDDGVIAEGSSEDPLSAQWTRYPMDECEQGYSVSLPLPDQPTVIYYRFRVKMGDDELLYAKREDGRSTAGSVTMADAPSATPEASGFQITVYDPSFQTPDWFKGKVMYQIFPDRFARGQRGILSEGLESHERRGWPVKVHVDWNEPPDWEEPYEPVDFYGGTLQGIEESLDYLESLGIDVLYLNPICEARSNHRYNTGDYEAVDPILGDWEAFESLARAAGERGMRIVLDTVLSHTGSASRYFNLDDSYDSLGAAQSEDSPFRDWYDFLSTSPYAPYRCWWNDPTLPEIEELNPSWQSFMLGRRSAGEGEVPSFEDANEAEAGVLGTWISRGAGGVRLDVADEIPDEALEQVRACVKAADAQALIIGEVWEDATNKESYGSKRTYALGRSLDSVMNYPLRQALLDFALRNIDAQQLVAFLKTQQMNYPKPFYFACMNLLSSHDVERVRSVLDLGYQFRDLTRSEQVELVGSISEEADWRGASLQKIIALLMYMLPGIPCVYYGDERGLQGGRDPFCRATFPWDGQRADCGISLEGFYRRIARLKHSDEVLGEGDAVFYSYMRDIACVMRLSHEGEVGSGAFICIANMSERPVRIALDLLRERAGLSKRQKHWVRHYARDARCIFSTNEWAFSQPASIEDGMLDCCVDAQQACVIQLNPGMDKPLEPGRGVICHITSVPNPSQDGKNKAHGKLGTPAKRFVDWLAEQGYRYWQILPLNPTDEFGSPYAGLSAFAGNVRLVNEAELPEFDEDAYKAFRESNADWLVPYATFVAIKKLVGERPWRLWPSKYKEYDSDLASAPELAIEVEAECRRQFDFERQWEELHAYAKRKGIRIIGDMPMYVSADSADAWAYKRYLALDEDGNVAYQGGVPPDSFSAEGQLWGNPTYDWEALEENGFDWWIWRLRRMFHLYDYVRLDHFIGFSAYYRIPAGASALEGEWVDGPGLRLFQRACEELGPLPVVAEDLGLLTPESRQLVAQAGFAGMDVIQFFDQDPLDGWHVQPRKMAFTSTHDTQTLVGWAKSRYCHGLDEEEAASKAKEIAKRLRSHVLRSTAKVKMESLQDVLELDDSARMNVPGTCGENWTWQASPSMYRN